MVSEEEANHAQCLESHIMVSYFLQAVTLVLLLSGFIMQAHSRSPYAGVAMDANAIAKHRRGQAISFLGIVSFLIYLWAK